MKQIIDYKKELSVLYNSFYTLDVNNTKRCKYFNECSNGMCTKYGFDSSYTIKVGENYGLSFEELVIPKVLIIGKESINKTEKFETPARFEEWESGSPNRHYIETFKQLKEIFNFNTSQSRNYKKQDDRILTLFSLSNRYRCAFKNTDKNQNRGIPNNDLQNKNCKEILIKEIEILEPDIIIIQSNKIEPTELIEDCVIVGINKSLYHSKKMNCYIMRTYYPTCPKWNCGGKFSRKDFLDNIIYLREKGIIPKTDTTDIIKKLIAE